MSEKNSSLGNSPHDPGWNDPPLFSYDSLQSSSKGCSLNKRIAYTFDHRNTESPKGVNSCAGKSCFPSGPPPTASKISHEEFSELSENQSNIEISLSALQKNFSKIIGEVCNEENQKETSEIRRRLTVMEKMWNEQKFPSAMQDKLYQISECLLKNDIDTCDSLQRSVMVDYTSLCSSWMPAIRMLINAKRTNHV